MSEPKKKSRSGPSGPTPTQAQRRANGRPVVSMVLSTDALAELDRRRGELARGAFVETLLRRADPQNR